MNIKLTEIKKIILFIFLSYHIQIANAQVTMGLYKTPEPFSALELNSTTGGLRLPQLKASDRDMLELKLMDKQSAKGLVIFNLTTNRIEYWNGVEWVEAVSRGKFSSTDIDFSKQSLVLLRDVELNIRDSVITLKKMKGAELDTDKGKVYATNELGSAILVDKLELRPSLEASNGLTSTLDTEASKYIVELGGTLAKKTTIDHNGFDLEFISTDGIFRVNDSTLWVDSKNNRVGINTAHPRTTLDIGGPFSTRHTRILVEDAGTEGYIELAIPTNMGQVDIHNKEGAEVDTEKYIEVTLPNEAEAVAGQQLMLINDSKQLAYVDKQAISPSRSMEFVYTNSTWQPTASETVISEAYNGQAVIPQFMTITEFDPNNGLHTDDWFVISVTNSGANNSTSDSKFISVTYQYRGEPFDIDKTYAFLTAMYPSALYCFNLTLKSLNNDGIDPIDGRTGRTEMTVGITRVDYRSTASATWTNNTLLNILMTNSFENKIP